MILLVMVVVGFIIGLVSGGSLAGFSQTRFRFLPLLLVSGLVQLVIFTEYLGREQVVRDAAPYLYPAALAVGLVALYLNRHIFGMTLILVGAALNFLAITLNGGSMPAREASLRTAGTYDEISRNEALHEAGAAVQWPQITIADSDTRLLILGDILPIPEGFPFANVISIGDVLISAGAIIAVVWVMHLKPAQAKSENQLAVDGSKPSSL